MLTRSVSSTDAFGRVLIKPGMTFADIQALVNSKGAYTAFYFYPDATYDFGAGLNNLLKSSAEGQSFISEGKGAKILNGGLEAAHKLLKYGRLRLSGASTYGLKITDASFFLPGEWGEGRATQLYAEHLDIYDKTYGVYNVVSGIWNRFFHLWVTRCGTGVYIDHSDQVLDSGDWHFTTCRIQHSTGKGMHIIKIGGVALCDTKFQFNDIGLLLEPKDNAATMSPVQGTYITGCQFEDNATWDIKLSALAAVDAAHYPRWTQIVGGTAHKTLLNKCDYTSIHGLLSNISLQIDAGATATEIIGTPYVSITGAGTDYTLIGNNAANGPYIKTGTKLKVIDAYGSAFIGPYITSISFVPNYTGQRALVAGEWYTAKGTATVADWVKDSGGAGGGGIDGGIFGEAAGAGESTVDGGTFGD